MADILMAFFWTVVLGFASGARWMIDDLQLWLAIPTMFVFLDATVNSAIAVRNAYQRTEVSPTSSNG